MSHAWQRTSRYGLGSCSAAMLSRTSESRDPHNGHAVSSHPGERPVIGAWPTGRSIWGPCFTPLANVCGSLVVEADCTPMDGPVKAKTRQSGRTGCKPVPRAWAGLQAQPRRDLQIAQPSRPRALLDPGKPVTQGEQESHDTQPDEVNDPKIVAVV